MKLELLSDHLDDHGVLQWQPSSLKSHKERAHIAAARMEVDEAVAGQQNRKAHLTISYTKMRTLTGRKAHQRQWVDNKSFIVAAWVISQKAETNWADTVKAFVQQGQKGTHLKDETLDSIMAIVEKARKESQTLFKERLEDPTTCGLSEP